ncbi:ATP-binding cassette subfamily C protein CydCD [Glaciihabitans tibetensis]|uniref:ATP-binding cassette subfamily C protein CydCD n=1 Tax=Glaciihabitans tibetensis TaxID=1266600 RepID=A0A2T0VAK4_9MICO|nr:thiol reductant ABC exporter subunit CydD [Glaciihabitans tibetensis]PRY67226.1 ATP-binding cassette subfamily C protein CydCD [Glaciihabitans tibetensis]
MSRTTLPRTSLPRTALPRAADRLRLAADTAFARAGLGPGGMRTLYVLGILSALKGLALVGLAESLARGVVGVIQGADDWSLWLGLGVSSAILRAIAHWATQAFAAREALGVKEATRQDLADKLVGDGGSSVGAMTSLATQGLNELDKYYSVVLPAVTSAAVIPALIGVRILFADWVSALIVVLTIPLVPVFMALIGMHTQERVSAASASLGRLSDNLVELARGLPVLVGLGRVEEQTEALRTISDNYRLRTMETLRTAFLSSLALELISTISVAVVAVFVGVRLVDGSLPLEIGLLALILAPECYAPFRDLGASFHAAQDGVLSLGRARGIIAARSPEQFVTPAATPAVTPAVTAAATPAVTPAAAAERGAPAIRVTDLTAQYDGRGEPAVDALSFVAPAGEITAICGVSGSGKSTVLAILAGRLRNGTDGAILAGEVTGIDVGRLAWVPQHPHTVGATVRDELRLYGGTRHPALAFDTALGLELELESTLDARIDTLLAELRLSHTVDADPAQLSPGELRRVAVARALLRVDAGAEVVLLDEPTAHVDAHSSRIIEDSIAALRGRVTVVLASHEVGVTNLASVRVYLDSSAAGRDDAVGQAQAQGQGLGQAQVATPHRVAHETSAIERPLVNQPSPVSTPAFTPVATPKAQPAPAPGALRLILSILRPAKWRFVFAVFLGALAALFAVSLTATSGWLIVRASQQPSMMYLMVAIVGVRFFGVGRATLRYAERLVTHDGIFAAVTSLRVRIWKSLAERGTSSRALLRGGTALDYLVVTADAVRDLAPRVLMPPVVGLLTGVAAVIGVAMLHSPAVPVLVVSLVLSLFVAPALATWGDRRASRGQQLIRSEVTRRFAALLAAADDLRTNAVDSAERASLRGLDARAGVDARRSAWALGLGGSFTVAVNCVTAVLMLWVSAPAVAAGTLPGEVLAVLVLLPLGLLEPLLGVVDAVQQWPVLAQAVRRLAPFTPSTAAGSSAVPGVDLPSDVDQIALRDLSARWPDTGTDTDTDSDNDTDVFSGLNAHVGLGEWLVVSGPSGSGKSTLLTVLLGYLQPSGGSYLVDGLDSRILDTRALRRHIAWAPQEGHLFDSTLRANLLLARSRQDAPDEAEMIDALRRVGLAEFLVSLPDGLDTRVGSEGAQLSGGQRQRVAVARTLLTRAEVVLLDEPTAHLDGEASARLMYDLRSALSDQIAVLVTHHLADQRDGDRVLQLQGSSVQSRQFQSQQFQSSPPPTHAPSTNARSVSALRTALPPPSLLK